VWESTVLPIFDLPWCLILHHHLQSYWSVPYLRTLIEWIVFIMKTQEDRDMCSPFYKLVNKLLILFMPNWCFVKFFCTKGDLYGDCAFVHITVASEIISPHCTLHSSPELEKYSQEAPELIRHLISSGSPHWQNAKSWLLSSTDQN